MSKPTVKSKQAAYDAGNLEAARIIAADPDKYPGVMQEWAQMILDTLGNLFERRAA